MARFFLFIKIVCCCIALSLCLRISRLVQYHLSDLEGDAELVYLGSTLLPDNRDAAYRWLVESRSILAEDDYVLPERTQVVIGSRDRLMDVGFSYVESSFELDQKSWKEKWSSPLPDGAMLIGKMHPLWIEYGKADGVVVFVDEFYGTPVDLIHELVHAAQFHLSCGYGAGRLIGEAEAQLRAQIIYYSLTGEGYELKPDSSVNIKDVYEADGQQVYEETAQSFIAWLTWGAGKDPEGMKRYWRSFCIEGMTEDLAFERAFEMSLAEAFEQYDVTITELGE